MASVDTSELVERIWARDATVWTGRDESRWLGWLDEPSRQPREQMQEGIAALRELEFADCVLLGMGGSSLAPEVMRRTVGAALEQLARERDFAAVIWGEPTIGGRYSALSPFGPVPAGLMGMDVGGLI